MKARRSSLGRALRYWPQCTGPHTPTDVPRESSEDCAPTPRTDPATPPPEFLGEAKPKAMHTFAEDVELCQTFAALSAR